MSILLKRPIALLFLLLATYSSYSQMKEATIFFNDSTSVLGLGEIKKEKIYFKVDPDEEASEWSYDMVKGIVFSGYGYSETYEFVPLKPKDAPEIVEVLQEGNLILYRKIKVRTTVDDLLSYTPSAFGPGTVPFPNSPGVDNSIKTLYYAKRKNEAFPTLIVFGNKKKLLEYFDDCPILRKKIIDKVFTKDTIEDMIEYYNNYCNDEH